MQKREYGFEKDNIENFIQELRRYDKLTEMSDYINDKKPFMEIINGLTQSEKSEFFKAVSYASCESVFKENTLEGRVFYDENGKVMKPREDDMSVFLSNKMKKYVEQGFHNNYGWLTENNIQLTLAYLNENTDYTMKNIAQDYLHFYPEERDFVIENTLVMDLHKDEYEKFDPISQVFILEKLIRQHRQAFPDEKRDEVYIQEIIKIWDEKLTHLSNKEMEFFLRNSAGVDRSPSDKHEAFRVAVEYKYQKTAIDDRFVDILSKAIDNHDFDLADPLLTMVEEMNTYSENPYRKLTPEEKEIKQYDVLKMLLNSTANKCENYVTKLDSGYQFDLGKWKFLYKHYSNEAVIKEATYLADKLSYLEEDIVLVVDCGKNKLEIFQKELTKEMLSYDPNFKLEIKWVNKNFNNYDDNSSVLNVKMTVKGEWEELVVDMIKKYGPMIFLTVSKNVPVEMAIDIASYVMKKDVENIPGDEKIDKKVIRKF